MRKVFLAGATALAFSSVSAQAGGVKEAVIAPAVIEQTTVASSSDQGLIVPLLLILVIAAVLAGQSGSTPPV